MSYYTVGFLVMIFFKEDTDRAGLWGEKIENKITKFTSVAYTVAYTVCMTNDKG